MNKEANTKGNVLVVEDDRDFSVLISSVLACEGYEITMAYTCEEAVEKIHERTPDLITLDLQMPPTQRKSGIHFYQEIKSAEDFRQVPIVVITGIMHDDRDMENMVRSSLETDRVPPPDAYIDKPFVIKALLETVENALHA